MVLGALTLSIVMTVGLVLMDTDASSSITAKQKEEAAKIVEDEYFGNPERGDLLPYQRYLREAKQAGCRGDRKGERQCYRKVLDLLRTEPRGGASSLSKRLGGFEAGVTGSRDRDRRLESQVITLMGE